MDGRRDEARQLHILQPTFHPHSTLPALRASEGSRDGLFTQVGNLIFLAFTYCDGFVHVETFWLFLLSNSSLEFSC